MGKDCDPTTGGDRGAGVRRVLLEKPSEAGENDWDAEEPRCGGGEKGAAAGGDEG